MFINGMIFRLIFIWLISSAISELCSKPDSLYTFSDIGNGKFVTDAVEDKNETKLNMTVFYEGLCPDSINFFKNQFSNTWSPFYDYLNITLVPYGNASQKKDKKGNWNFVCQHGEKECEANRIQACAIARMRRRREKLFAFISCYMSFTDKDQYGPICAHSSNIAFKRLKKCAISSKGYELLATYGNLTHEFRPIIDWIPTIVFNNKYNQTENNLASSDLKSLLCQKLNNQPNACTTQI